jgi:hypothetical protein
LRLTFVAAGVAGFLALSVDLPSWQLTVGQKRASELHRPGLRFGLIPIDKIAQRSQTKGVLGLCITQCDLLAASTAGKKLIRR